MSSGQQRWAEDIAEEAEKAHIERLKQLTPSALIRIVEDLKRNMNILEKSATSLPRSGWESIDALKICIERLS